MSKQYQKQKEKWIKQGKSEARKDFVRFLKECLIFDEGEDREDAVSRGMELEFDQMERVKQKIKELEGKA